MSFGKRTAEPPRWLEEDEIDEHLAQTGMDKPQGSGVSIAELAGGGAAVAIAFGATLYYMGVLP